MKLSGYALFLLTTFLLASCSDRLYNLVTVSPEKVYRVKLTETKTNVSPTNVWPYKVFLDLEKNGNVILQKDMLYVSDGWDLRFGDIAPDAEWVSERIMRLGGKKREIDQQYDWIEFYNNSSQALTYVFIAGKESRPGERFLLFDVKPDERIRVQAIAQTDEGADMSWISCSGTFEGGKVLSIFGRNFEIRGKYKSPSHYFITVKDDGATIESREYQPIK